MEEKRILLADKSEVCNLLAIDFLGRIGIAPENIVITKTTQETIQAATKQLFDLIILETADTVDAVEVVERIRGHHNGNTPKVIGYINPTKEHHPEKEVLDGILIKPVRFNTFLNRIFEVLNAQKQGVN
jgi:DNA-binding response OmpR family regulator